VLEPILTKLRMGEIGGEYLLDDEGLLWYAPKGEDPKLVIPRVMVPGVLALVHSTFGHPGVARTTLLVQGKYNWPTLVRDVREYVLSCGCRRRKRANSQRIAMMPARFLRPWEVLEMDIQDLKQESQDGNRYLLVVVDRASKFLFAYPLPSKDAVGVSRKLLELLLTFGVPLSIRSDAGGEFTAQVVKHLCQWLRVSIDYGPSNHPRAQGAVERVGGWLQEVLSELCKSWPRIWDRYVLPACWIQRVTPDPSLPSSPTPFRLLFGRDARTQLDSITPVVDGVEYKGGLDAFVADKQQAFREVRKALEERKTMKDQRRQSHNDGIGRVSPGRQAKIGNYVLVKEAASTLSREGIHSKLAHEHWTGPWRVVRVIHPGLSYAVHLNGRCIRKRMVSVADIKPFHERPVELRHAFEDEFAHLAWGPDIGLAEVSTAAAPLYTLIDRKVSWIKEDTWVWEYKGRHQDGVESNWLSEEEAQESFTPLQLDVFHALWERYHGADHRARPPGMPTREEKAAASREVALKAFPIGTKVRRELKCTTLVTHTGACDIPTETGRS